MSESSQASEAPASTYDMGHREEAEDLATFAVLVDNEPGVLHRVVGLFAARGYNIESLTVAETDHNAHSSRITIVTRGTPHVLAQIEAQLEKIPYMLVVGEKEQQAGTVSVRDRIDGDLGAMPLAEAIGKLKAEISEKRVRQVAKRKATGLGERGEAHEY